MNIDRRTSRLFTVGLTGALWLLAIAWPSGAGADIVPNRRGAAQPGAEQPTQPDRDIVPNRTCAARLAGTEDCKPGFVWRLAGPEDRVCVYPNSRERAAQDNADAPHNVVPEGADGPNTCRVISGDERLVWRNAFPGDFVCVDTSTRDWTREENRDAASRRACN